METGSANVASLKLLLLKGLSQAGERAGLGRRVPGSVGRPGPLLQGRRSVASPDHERGPLPGEARGFGRGRSGLIMKASVAAKSWNLGPSGERG